VQAFYRYFTYGCRNDHHTHGLHTPPTLHASTQRRCGRPTYHTCVSGCLLRDGWFFTCRSLTFSRTTHDIRPQPTRLPVTLFGQPVVSPRTRFSHPHPTDLLDHGGYSPNTTFRCWWRRHLPTTTTNPSGRVTALDEIPYHHPAAFVDALLPPDSILVPGGNDVSVSCGDYIFATMTLFAEHSFGALLVPVPDCCWFWMVPVVPFIVGLFDGRFLRAGRNAEQHHTDV